MRRPRLFCPEIKPGSVVLPPEEARHALTVLRARAGWEVVLFDGAGTEAQAVIVHARQSGGAVRKGSGLRVEVASVYRRPFDFAYRLTLAVAMVKLQRQAYLIEKCTELGVSSIWPVIGERSVAHPGKGARDKWSRRAIEAAKQCGRSWVPSIAAPRSFADCVDGMSGFDGAAIALADSTTEPFLGYLSSFPRGASLVVFVGPEGGWSAGERRHALTSGAVPVTLAPTVLRTETAAVAVCAAVAMCSVSSSAP